MTFGLLLLFEYQNDFQDTLQKQLNLIKLFDKVIDRVWVTEHHYNPLRVNSAPLMILNHIAKYTNKDLGIATLLLGLYDPVYTAESISMLSNLINRKLYIGIAKGGRSEVKNSHLNLTEELARKYLLSNLKTIQPLLKNESIIFNTKEFTLSPKTDKPIEFSIASLNEELIKYSALQNIPLMAGHKWSIEKIKKMILIYEKHHPTNQKPSIILSRMFCPTTNKKDVIESVKENMTKQRKIVSKFNKNHEPKLLDEMIFEESLIDTKEEIQKKLAFFKSLGVTHIILRPIDYQLNSNNIEFALGIKNDNSKLI